MGTEKNDIMLKGIMDRFGTNLLGICIRCGGTGRTREDPFHCKDCGRTYGPQTSHDGVTPVEIAGTYIPKKYREKPYQWELNSIKKIITDRCHGVLPKIYSRYLIRLNEIYEQISTDNMDFINTQVIICSDKDYLDILYIWVYSCIQAAYASRLSSHNIINPIDFDVRDKSDAELLEKDILFLELTSMDLEESLKKIEYICMSRSKMDRNTYIITNIKDIRILRTGMSISYDPVHLGDSDIKYNEMSLLKIIKQG